MLKLTNFTLREILIKSTWEFNNLPAFSWVGGRTWSYYGLKNGASKTAELLKSRNLKSGDRVAVLSENRPEWGMSYFGITASGFVVVPIMTDFGPSQIAHILEHSGTKVVFVSDKLKPKLQEAFSSMSESSGYRKPEIIAIEILSDAQTQKIPDEILFPEIPENSLAAIIYTSGTTGYSKGVMLSHKNIAWNAWANRSIIVMGINDVFLSVLPLAHTYECTLGLVLPVLQGSSIFYIDKPPSASVLLPALTKVRPTVVLSVPLLIEKIYRASILPKLREMNLYKNKFFKPLLEFFAGIKLKKVFGGRLRFFGIGGAPLTDDVEAFLKRIKFPYAIGYGLTETSPMCAGTAPFKTVRRSTGPALKGVSIRIANPDQSGEGEIQIHGPNVMQGYWRDEERTKEVFTEDGWFRTGDLGTIDRKKRLFIRGRLKNLILGASGENIYPEEVEAVLNQNEDVLESLVYKDDDSGLVALVHLKPEILEALGDAIQDEISVLEIKVRDLLEKIRRETNTRLATFSRLSKIIMQKEPFEKTPKQSIKRFLYGVKNTISSQKSNRETV